MLGPNVSLLACRVSVWGGCLRLASRAGCQLAADLPPAAALRCGCCWVQEATKASLHELLGQLQAEGREELTVLLLGVCA